LVAPWGYGDSGQRPLGEWDVLRVLDEVSKNYKIDERRVSMTGYSLGGTVAFFAPLHFPDRFSAAAPLCGYPNLLDYREVKRAKKRQPWEDILLQQRYIRNYTENGFATPMWVIHGDKDAPERSEVVVERAEALNYPVRFDVQPETGHNVWDYGYNPDTGLLRWLTGARKPAVPARVVLRTGDLRYARAHWVEVLGLEDGGRFAEVNAEWKKSSGQVVVDVRNASALKLDVEALGAAQVKVGGKTLGVPQGAAQVWLSKQDGDWTLSDKALDLSGRKRPGLSGPLDLALLKPTIFVYGTQDPTQTETLRQVAQDLARVSPRTAALYPVKADRDLTAQERKTHTLILLGNPRSNKLVAETQDTFGVTFEADALEFKGRRYEGPTVGISMIRPSPFAQDQYLVLHAGVDAVGTLAVRNLPELVPDWIVYDQGMTAQRGDTLLDKRSVLGGGFFGADWR
jgi:pimeloyl-ACP methyl ester carboxylesterase